MKTAACISWCIALGKKLNLRQVVLFGILGALTFAAKVAMAALPNIEPVSLFVMLYVTMEILFYGIQVWNIYYLYIWLILLIAAVLLRKMESPVLWAILSGFFGLMFGALCAITDVFIGGPGYAVSKWTMGVYFDLLHCGGNFVMALLLFSPLRKLMERLYKQIQ